MNKFKTISNFNPLDLYYYQDIMKREDERKIENKYKINFNDQTIQFYKKLRDIKQDPITYQICNEHYFEFPYMWDPYTGERFLELDPYGSLCFDVYDLIYYFYINRLNGLWINSVDEKNGVYSGYYGDYLGSGQNISIKGRGEFPERYLFRLPIIDCYLTDDHDISIPSMGPKLTDDEIKIIYNSAEKNKKKYRNKFKKNLPNLLLIKENYDIAISNQVENDINVNAVEILKQM